MAEAERRIWMGELGVDVCCSATDSLTNRRRLAGEWTKVEVEVEVEVDTMLVAVAAAMVMAATGTMAAKREAEVWEAARWPL